MTAPATDAPATDAPATDAPAAAAGSRARFSPAELLPLLVVATLSTVATLAYGTVFSSWSILIPAAAGALAGSAITLAAQRFRLLFGEVFGLSVVTLVVVGVMVCFGAGFFDGIVRGWVEVLSATPPADLTPSLRAVPFATAFVASVVGGEFLRPARQSCLAVLGPILGLIITALFTEGDDRLHFIVGTTMVAGLLVLAWAQRRDAIGQEVSQVGDHHAAGSAAADDASTENNPGPLRWRSLPLVLGLLVSVVALAPFVAPRLPFADAAEDRLDLRELQTPPWDPLALPSPLVELKAALIADTRAEANPVLFTIAGTPPASDVQWRTASLVGFNGVFWSVADASGSDDFVPVDTQLPVSAGEIGTATEEAIATHTVTINSAMGHWVPVPGVPTRLEFTESTDVRMSPATGTLGVPDQLLPGATYEVRSTAWPFVPDEVLQEMIFDHDVATQDPDGLPPTIRKSAADFSEGIAQQSGERVISIRDKLRNGAYNLELPPGHSYGRIAEMLDAVDIDGSNPEDPIFQMLGVQGFEEQYAAIGALLVRLSDIPVRVGVGYVVPADRWSGDRADVRGTDASAWIEVLVEGVGWMPIPVTPDRAREPAEVSSGIEEVGVPVADPPKEPPPPDDADRPEISDAEPTPEPQPTPEPEEEVVVRAVPIGRIVGVSLFVPLVLLGLAGIAIVLIKGLRRRRRRVSATADAQIAGAWAELLDRLEETGAAVPRQATPMETARVVDAVPGLDSPAAQKRLQRLASGVTGSAFRPETPNQQQADAAWEDYDELVSLVQQEAGPVDRLRMSVDPRPLMGEHLPVEAGR